MKTNAKQSYIHLITGLFILLFLIGSCKKKTEEKEEQLTFSEYQQTDTPKGLSSTIPFTTSSNSVLLTGIDHIRLIPIYKIDPKVNRDLQYEYSTTYYNSRYYGYESDSDENFKYFMPGIDIIYGYNMVNMGHYDLTNDKLTYFFDHPVLIRTLYFPGTQKDSLYREPVMRDYFMASVYNEDTNRDSLINTRDMRRMFHIDQLNMQKTALLPPDYSAIRSTYDPKNDIMYIYARYDENGDGTPEKQEPIAIFRIGLKDPLNIRKMR